VIGNTDPNLLHVLYVLVAALNVLYVLDVPQRVRLEVVVVSRLYVLHILHVSEGMPLDVYLFFGSLAILILHSFLLSRHGVPINVLKTV
jgi:hypothetical protein